MPQPVTPAPGGSLDSCPAAHSAQLSVLLLLNLVTTLQLQDSLTQLERGHVPGQVTAGEAEMAAEPTPWGSAALPASCLLCGTSNSISAPQSPALTAAHHVTWEAIPPL